MVDENTIVKKILIGSSFNINNPISFSFEYNINETISDDGLAIFVCPASFYETFSLSSFDNYTNLQEFGLFKNTGIYNNNGSILSYIDIGLDMGNFSKNMSGFGGIDVTSSTNILTIRGNVDTKYHQYLYSTEITNFKPTPGYFNSIRCRLTEDGSKINIDLKEKSSSYIKDYVSDKEFINICSYKLPPNVVSNLPLDNNLIFGVAFNTVGNSLIRNISINY